jgi:hypothetical protein
VTKVKYEPHHGTATVLAKVSGPGKKIAPRGVRSSGAGIAKLKVTAKAGALKALKKTAKAKVKIALKFVTSEGGVATTSRSLTDASDDQRARLFVPGVAERVALAGYPLSSPPSDRATR